MSDNVHSKTTISFWASLLLCSTLLVFSPVSIYINNILDYPFSLVEILLYTAVPALLITIIFTSILSRLNLSLHQLLTALLFSLAFLFWFQNDVIGWNLGILDGKQIDWGRVPIYKYLDVLLWITLIILAIFRKLFIYNIAQKASIVLILTQLASLAAAAYQAPNQPEWKRFEISDEKQFAFSKERNVIIIVLDTFQSDVFQELLNENPNYRCEFSGFTYFRNTLGGFPTTYPSVPLILTGQYYNNLTPMQEFVKNAYSSFSVPKVLKQNGYRVDLFPPALQTVYCSDTIASNLQETSLFGSSKMKSVENIYHVVLFKTLPHLAKRYILNGTSNAVKSEHSDLEFIEKMNDSFKVSEGKPVFKYYHLSGAHPPFILNEKLERGNFQFNRINYKRQAAASIEVVRKFLKKLKDSAIYDNSMVFIVADHGIGSFELNINAAGYKDNTETLRRTAPDTIASGNPLFLVKPFKAAEAIKISDIPITLSDIPKTIVTELKISSSAPGRSVLDSNKDQNRVRKFYKYTWGHEYWKKDYLPALEEYIVTGNSWLDQSWQRTYKKYSSKGISSILPPVYEYGKRLKFTRGGQGYIYQEGGWSPPEDHFTWTNANNAQLIFPLKSSVNDLIFEAKLIPLKIGNIQGQRVNIFVNGKRIEGWKVSEAATYRFAIPRELIKENPLEIMFDLPDAAIASAVDKRKLGIAVKEITIFESLNYRYNSTIQFSQNGNAKNYMIKGWSEPEELLTWTEGKEAELKIPIKPSDKDLQLEADLKPLIVGDIKEQQVNIIVNEKKLGHWIVRDSGVYKLTIPKDHIRNSVLTIKMEIPNAKSPYSMKMGGDQRVLGLAVKTMVLKRTD